MGLASDAVTAGEGAATRRRRPGLGTIVRWSLFAVATGALAWAVVARWAEVSDAVAQMGWRRVALATALAAAALVFNTFSWRSVMAAVGLEASLREASGIFLVSQAGKYVPGAVWPVVAQAEFARGHGLSRSRSTAGSLVAMAVGVVTSGVVGAGALAVFSPGGLAEYWWAAVVAALLGVLLLPPVLSRLIGVALRVLRRPTEPVRIGGKALAASAGWSGLNWLALGGQALVLLKAVGGDDATFGLATGAFALAWLAGFLAVFLPAGAGVREAVLVALLGGAVAQPQAVALAVMSRFALTLADAIGLVVGAALRRSWRGKQRRTAAP